MAADRIPEIIKFSHRNLTNLEDKVSCGKAKVLKWSAVCKHCSITTTERCETTSGFVR